MKKDRYAVWGNPIAHSLSPTIHAQFARQTGQAISYEACLGDHVHFETQIQQFFATGGQGCNITAPFKQRAFALVGSLSERAILAQSCNTLKKMPDGRLFGDNTDGVGLVADLCRLHWLFPYQKILILGAGGAAQGVLFPLLQAKQRIYLYNRTFEKAEKLAQQFQPYGEIYATQADLPVKVDLIINATSMGKTEKLHPKIGAWIAKTPRIYDMQYHKTHDTPFLLQAKSLGAKHCQDGLGMLVGQGAESFRLWRNVDVDERIVLHQLRQI